jgi:hypothetical protein
VEKWTEMENPRSRAMSVSVRDAECGARST